MERLTRVVASLALLAAGNGCGAVAQAFLRTGAQVAAVGAQAASTASKKNNASESGGASRKEAPPPPVTYVVVRQPSGSEYDAPREHASRVQAAPQEHYTRPSAEHAAARPRATSTYDVPGHRETVRSRGARSASYDAPQVGQAASREGSPYSAAHGQGVTVSRAPTSAYSYPGR
jgi:hypothetical protein